MTQPRSARKPAASRSRGAAARAEKSDEKAPKVVEFEGLTLTLVDEFPEELFFDMVESEASQAEGNGVNGYVVHLRILRSLVGADQFTEIRHTVGRDAAKVMELLNALLEQYGLTVGESEASPES